MATAAEVTKVGEEEKTEGEKADSLIKLALSTMDESILLKRAARRSAQKVAKCLEGADLSAKRASSK